MNNLKRKNKIPLIMAAPGMVKIQVKEISITFFQLTRAFLSAPPTPITPAVTTWVVLKGIPPKLFKKIKIDEQNSVENP